EVAAQPQLHVPGPLELFENDLVHLRPGLDQGGGENRQRPTVLDVSSGSEELLGRVQGTRVHAAGEDPSAGRRGKVVRPTQPGDRVQQNDDVVSELDQPFGALDGELSDGRVVVGGTIEGRGDDLAVD